MKLRPEQSAGGVVFKKENGKTLWLVVSPNGQSWWGLPKGHIGDKVRNETKEEAASREVKEETNIAAEIVNEIPHQTQYMFRKQNYLIKKTVYYFLMKYISGELTVQSTEIREAKWVTKEEAEKIITYEGDKEAFKTLSSQLSGAVEGT